MKNSNQLTLNFFDTLEFIPGCVDNIRSMLPKLFPTQVEDVAAAENRFQQGKGYLFTNGTGTGKTYVGLGITKRFYDQDKREILIVVPTQKKCSDWAEEAVNFGLKVYQLNGIEDEDLKLQLLLTQIFIRIRLFLIENLI